MFDFCITGYPRSRTAWFAAFFTTGDIFCHHEMAHAESEKRIVGVSGSNFAINPIKTKTVIIERDIDEVRSSLSRLTPLSETIINLIDLNSLSGLRVKYEHIDERLEEIWCYCVDDPFPIDRAELFKNLIIEQNYERIIEKTGAKGII